MDGNAVVRPVDKTGASSKNDLCIKGLREALRKTDEGLQYFWKITLFMILVQKVKCEGNVSCCGIILSIYVSTPWWCRLIYVSLRLYRSVQKTCQNLIQALFFLRTRTSPLDCCYIWENSLFLWFSVWRVFKPLGFLECFIRSWSLLTIPSSKAGHVGRLAWAGWRGLRGRERKGYLAAYLGTGVKAWYHWQSKQKQPIQLVCVSSCICICYCYQLYYIIIFVLLLIELVFVSTFVCSVCSRCMFQALCQILGVPSFNSQITL